MFAVGGFRFVQSFECKERLAILRWHLLTESAVSCPFTFAWSAGKLLFTLPS